MFTAISRPTKAVKDRFRATQALHARPQAAETLNARLLATQAFNAISHLTKAMNDCFRPTQLRTPDLAQHRLGKQDLETQLQPCARASLAELDHSVLHTTDDHGCADKPGSSRDIGAGAGVLVYRHFVHSWSALTLSTFWKREPMAISCTLSSITCMPSQCSYAHFMDHLEAGVVHNLAYPANRFRYSLCLVLSAPP